MSQRVKAMQETIDSLTEKNAGLLTQKAMFDWHSDSDTAVVDVVNGYMMEIEKLQARLIEADQMYQNLKKSINSPRNAQLRNAALPSSFDRKLHTLSNKYCVKLV